MKKDEINELEKSFFEGNTTLGEEQLLMTRFKKDVKGDGVLSEDKIVIPKGLEERLSLKIDSLEEAERAQHQSRSIPLYWVKGIAASLLILLSVGSYIWYNRPDSPNSSNNETAINTVSDSSEMSQPSEGVSQNSTMQITPDEKEACEQAEKALRLLAVNLKKGLNSADLAQKKSDKVTEIIHKNVLN
ncbi:MAG: hypothetical protein PHI48_03945 [Bacteroidales bacterium]|nr:hypothetical protein [Bacteroidales bacterium]